MDPLSLLKPLFELGKKIVAPFSFLASSCYVVMPEEWLTKLGGFEFWTEHKGIISAIWLCSGSWLIVQEAQARLEKRAERIADDKRRVEIVAEIKTLDYVEQLAIAKMFMAGGTCGFHIGHIEYPGAMSAAARGLADNLGHLSVGNHLFRLKPVTKLAIEGGDWEDAPVMLQIHPQHKDRALAVMRERAAAEIQERMERQKKREEAQEQAEREARAHAVEASRARR